ncbi:MAG: hypothetical protein VX705_06590, partial [Verrucomicrobiota bacterium]|nr:hypothetical protein [Verrucomicrobiota bacterium]
MTLFRMQIRITMLAAMGLTASLSAQEKPTAAQIDFFEKKIRPVLVNECYKCHSANSDKVKGGLLLDTK